MSKASNPYYTGQQQISLIFMECIGCNKELYAALRQKYRDYRAKEASKRPADVDLDPRGKKKRAE